MLCEAMMAPGRRELLRLALNLPLWPGHTIGGVGMREQQLVTFAACWGPAPSAFSS